MDVAGLNMDDTDPKDAENRLGMCDVGPENIDQRVSGLEGAACDAVLEERFDVCVDVEAVVKEPSSSAASMCNLSPEVTAAPAPPLSFSTVPRILPLSLLHCLSFFHVTRLDCRTISRYYGVSNMVEYLKVQALKYTRPTMSKHGIA